MTAEQTAVKRLAGGERGPNQHEQHAPNGITWAECPRVAAIALTSRSRAGGWEISRLTQDIGRLMRAHYGTRPRAAQD
ncbi:hypothetical protein HDV57DRAFT_495878, partial [Trichoderma longibrachiatum]